MVSEFPQQHANRARDGEINLPIQDARSMGHSGKDAMRRPQAIAACLVGIIGLYRTINNGFCARKIL
jgi:hypothetical protein